jgi:hypothetical protein
MEFDADWIWFGVFAVVLIVRALGGLISRARQKAEVQLPQVRIGSKDSERFEADRVSSSAGASAGAETPKPIEPR